MSHTPTKSGPTATQNPNATRNEATLSDAEARIGVLLPPSVSRPRRVHTSATATIPPGRVRWSATRTAYAFYGVAAAGAVIGQTWVALDRLNWPASIPYWVRVLAVLPFALCLELLAMALAAMADERLRLGERAYGFRFFSGIVAVVAVGIQVGGHWPDFYWSSVFGLLSTSAYLLWLLHSGARRRDALRDTGKLADTAPDYGLWRRLRHPLVTARAAELAREGRTDPHTGTWHPLGLFESLRAAEQAIGDEKRRPAVARAVEQVVRADQRDPHLAEVAVRTLDLDRLAAELATRVDYTTWADRLAPAITAPAAPDSTDPDAPTTDPTGTPPTAQGGPFPPVTVPVATLPPYEMSPHEPVPQPDNSSTIAPEPESPTHEPHTTTDEKSGHDQDGEADDGMNLDPDLAPLLPAARAARDELAAEGRAISRDALAYRLRRDGHAIRNDRVSELVKTLRREDTTVSGTAPTVRA